MAKGMDQFFKDLASGKFQGQALENLHFGIRGLGLHFSGDFMYRGVKHTKYVAPIQASSQKDYFHFVNFLAFLKREYLPSSLYSTPTLFRLQYVPKRPSIGQTVICKPKSSTTSWTSDQAPVIYGREKINEKSVDVILRSPSDGVCLFTPKVADEFISAFRRNKSSVNKSSVPSRLKVSFSVTVSELEYNRGEKEYILYHGKNRKPFKAKVHDVL